MSQEVTIIIPTVTGREDHLDRCLTAYMERTSHRKQILIIKDMPTVGQAWLKGMESAEGDYIHMTADDLEPHEGWDEAAVEGLSRGWYPAPRILKPDGSLDTCGHMPFETNEGYVAEFSEIPFLTRAQYDRWGPMIPLHYYTDNWLSHRAKEIDGVQSRVCREYCFTHHWAQWARGAGMTQNDRMTHDHSQYMEYVQGFRIP